jgi:hypothetical protein
MVLLIVGLAVGLPLLICGGITVWVVMSVQKGLTDLGGTFGSDIAATAFITQLKTDPKGAYDNTTANFKSGLSKEQFDKLLKDHPVLTSTNRLNQSGLPALTGTAPNRKTTITFSVVPGGPDTDFTTPTTGTGGTGPKPPPTTPATGPAPQSVTVTLEMVEQSDNSWKVDKMSVK